MPLKYRTGSYARSSISPRLIIFLFFLTDGERIRQEIKNDHHYLTITDLTFGDKGKNFSIIISIVGGSFMKIMEEIEKKINKVHLVF